MNIELEKYEKMYDSFDAGHDRRHLESVRQRAVELAKKYLPDQIDLAYIAATLHDVGLSVNRDNHENEGAELVLRDLELQKLLGQERLAEVTTAIKEHRASSGNPKTILAKIISDADRGTDDHAEAVRRPLEFGKANFPDLNEDEQLKRAGDHIVSKFSQGSYGRRCYFSETEKRLTDLYEPIIEAYKTGGVQALKKILG